MNRRSFLRTGLSAIICAPAIVRASSLMHINSVLAEADEIGVVSTQVLPSGMLYTELCAVTRRAYVPSIFVQLYRADALLNDLMRAA